MLSSKKKLIYTPGMYLQPEPNRRGDNLDQYLQALHVLPKDCQFKDAAAQFYK